MDKEQQEKANNEIQMSGYTQQILSNPAYKQAMMILRADIIDKFGKVSSKNVEDLQELNRRMHAIDDFQNLLERTMQNGRIAEKKMNAFTKALNKIRNK